MTMSGDGWKRGGRHLLAGVAVCSLTVTAGCAPVGDRADADVLVLRGRVIDGTGAAAIENGVVVIAGGRVRCAGPRGTCTVPRNAEVVRVTAGTILPGLIDLHTHARPHYLAWFLEAGVTTVRDANNSLDMIESLLTHEGHRPRIVWSGPLLDGERSIMSFFAELRGPFDGPMGDMSSVRVRTPEEARAAVDTLARRGAGVIKLYEQLDHRVFVAAVERAGEHGVRTMTDLGLPGTRGLAGAEVDALEAAAAGVGSIEHASGYALAFQRLGGDVESMPYDPALIDRMARATVAAGTAVVPTLSVTYAYSDSVTEIEGLPAADRIPQDMLDFFEGGAARRTALSRERSLQGYAMAAAVARRVRELGGLVGAGSDTPAGVFNIPGGGLHRELELMVREGATPLEALHSATGVAAAILGRDDIGILRAGAVADILIVDGKPDEDILHTRRIRNVIQDGRRLPLDSLRVAPSPSQ
jgi:imidazolonepropionase-like amidohydrolase